MSNLVKSLSVVVALILGQAAVAPAWEIPLTVENGARTGVPPCVSGGVPLLPGQAKEPANLRLAVRNAAGQLVVIPAQFRVLARYWCADNSIRWVLVDFASADVPGEKKVVYLYLTDANGTTPAGAGAPQKLDLPAPKAAVSVQEEEDTVVVSTGAAVFTISKKKFNFLQGVTVGDEELVAGSPDTGLVIEDIFGEKYYGSEGAKEVTVLESGPMRACVRARGQHLARGGKGYSRGMYGYDVVMNFYAGRSDVTADVIVTNNFAKSIGEPLMKDASLLVKLAGGAKGCRVYGAAPLDAGLAAGSSICLCQDSNGAETWQICQGYTGNARPGGTCFNGKTVAFRGYRIVRRADGKEEIVASGDQGRGLIRLSNDRGGVVMHTRNFWQQFPKAVEAAGDGTLRLGMFPRESIVPHYIDDAAAKGHEVVLYFYAKGKSAYAADGQGHTWPHVFADAWDPPAYPRPPLAHIAATGALSDLGAYSVPEQGFVDYDTAVNLRRLFMTDEYKGNGLGWQVFGERWDSHGGHSTHGARQPIKEDNFLFKYYVTGGPGWLDAGINRSRNFRDVRAYRIDDTDALAYKDWAAFRKANTSESREWTNRPIPADEELKKYQAGLVPHARWEFPNPEHCTLDLLYDRYLLLGDVRAYENMRVVCGHGGFFAIASAPSIHRNTGWSWRALERYWELTGDKRAGELLKDTMKAYAPLIGKKPLWAANVGSNKNWFTQVWTRAQAMTTLHTGDPQMLELAKATADGKEDNAGYFCALFATLYHLTGDVKYKDAVLAKTDGGRKLLQVAEPGEFPAAVHWLLTQPPAKATPANPATP